MRSNFSTQAAMAWALFRNAQLSQAIQYIRFALSSGVRDARTFSIAATIFEASGDAVEGQKYAQMALQINPRHRDFHLHH